MLLFDFALIIVPPEMLVQRKVSLADSSTRWPIRRDLSPPANLVEVMQVYGSLKSGSTI